MPSAVLDIELSDSIPDAGGLDRYTDAFVVFRPGGVPVGHGWVPVTSCRLDHERLREAAERALPAFSRRWLERQLGRDLSDARELPLATVAICTRERPDDLARTLVAVHAAARGRPILVIDNRPHSDRTREAAAAWPQVQYVREDRPGLNAARNRALREARTEIVAFTDDDAAPEAQWLDALLRNFDHPLVAAVT
jgi:hypothetical protein